MNQYSPEQQPRYLVEDESKAFYLATAENLTRNYFEDYPRRIDGSTVVDHISRIINLYDETLGSEPPAGLIAATYLHDRVECLYKEGCEEQQIRLKQDIQTLYELDPKTTVYAIGVAVSANKFEGSAEAWRNIVQGVLVNDKHPDANFLDSKLESIIESTNSTFTVEQLKERMAQAIHSGRNSISRELLQWRAPMGDIREMANTLGNWDIEGLILKSTEVMDNLRHPNPNRPASAWRDAQELLSYYAPLLEMGGFDRLSREAYSYAYRYLNGDPEFSPKNEDGLPVPYVGLTNEEISRVNKAYYLYNEGLAFNPEIASLEPERINCRGQIIWDMLAQHIGSEGRVEGRIKSIGSIMEKLKKGNVPDLVGYKLVLPDNYSFDELEELTLLLAKEIADNNDIFIDIGHTREDEPSIQFNFPEILEEASYETRVGNQNTLISMAPPRAISSYSAAHINFHYTTPEGEDIGVEIQVTRKSEDDSNTKGRGHHVFYKASKSIGDVARMRRLVEEDPEKYGLGYYNMVDYIISIIMGIENRSKIFKEGNKGQELSQRSMLEIIQLLDFDDSQIF